MKKRIPEFQLEADYNWGYVPRFGRFKTKEEAEAEIKRLTAKFEAEYPGDDIKFRIIEGEREIEESP